MSSDIINQILLAIISGSVPAIAIMAGMKAQLVSLKEYVRELKTDLHSRVDHHEKMHHEQMHH